VEPASIPALAAGGPLPLSALAVCKMRFGRMVSALVWVDMLVQVVHCLVEDVMNSVMGATGQRRKTASSALHMPVSCLTASVDAIQIGPARDAQTLWGHKGTLAHTAATHAVTAARGKAPTNVSSASKTRTRTSAGTVSATSTGEGPIAQPTTITMSTLPTSTTSTSRPPDTTPITMTGTPTTTSTTPVRMTATKTGCTIGTTRQLMHTTHMTIT
jgi:hypothetical protein